MCSLGNQWKRSAGLVGRISSSWSVDIVWIHCCSCFRHGFTLFTCGCTWSLSDYRLYSCPLHVKNKINVCTSVLYLPGRHPGNVWLAVPGKTHVETPFVWGFPASSPRSAHRAWAVDAPLAAYAPSATAFAQVNTSIMEHIKSCSSTQPNHNLQTILLLHRQM